MHKRIVLIIALLFTFVININAADNDAIKKIRQQFSKWQPILKDSTVERKIFYHLFTGENFSTEKWTNSYTPSDEIFVGDELQIIDIDSLGTFVLLMSSSPSGDWFIHSENYYWSNGNLFFVFWKMNTYQASEPSTVERRIYFNESGEEIRSLESVYKLNTKGKIRNPNFMNREVIYWKTISELPASIK